VIEPLPEARYHRIGDEFGDARRRRHRQRQIEEFERRALAGGLAPGTLNFVIYVLEQLGRFGFTEEELTTYQRGWDLDPGFLKSLVHERPPIPLAWRVRATIGLWQWRLRELWDRLVGRLRG
jgi:hypothetical protein